MLALLDEMQRRGEVLRPNLVVCASLDEETGCGGAPVFARWVRRRGLKLDQLLVAEATMCAPIYGHKGSSNVIFEIHGEAGHSSKPHGSRVYASACCALKLAIRVRAVPTPVRRPRASSEWGQDGGREFGLDRFGTGQEDLERARFVVMKSRP